MADSRKSPGIDWSDMVRAYATVAVVALHVLFADDWKYHTAAVWWFADMLHAFVKPAVPLFVMVSGAFLLIPEKPFTLWKFWKSRFFRVLLPFLAWTLVYAAWEIDYNYHWPLFALPRKFLTGQVYDHLWFVYMLAGLYVALPILRRFVAGATQAEMHYFLILWFIVVGILPPLLSGIPDNPSGYLVVTTGFTGYFVGGYWLAQLRITPGMRKYLIAGAVVVAVLNGTLAHHFAASTDEYFDEDFSILSDLGPTVAILSALVFLLFRSIDYSRVGRCAAVIKIISVAGYGIYLSHMLILAALGDGLFFGIKFTASTFSPWVGIPLAIFVITALSLGLLLLLQRIPILRVLSPMGKSHDSSGSTKS